MRNEFGVSHAGESAPLSKLRAVRRRKREVPLPRKRMPALKKQPNVNELQRWVQEVITHPQGVPAGIQSAAAQALIPLKTEALEKVILPSRNLSSEERIGIYADMYHLRLVECLSKDFEALKYALGDDRFEEIARLFITAHPSTSYSLNLFGAKMARFLQHEMADLPNRQFLVDLARLEWAVQETFEEKNVQPLTPAQIAKVPKKKWDTARIQLIPAFRLMKFDFPVNAFFQAVITEKGPGLPEPRKNWLRIYRRGYRVWRARLDENQYNLLDALASGTPLAAALEECVAFAGGNGKKVAASIGQWFQEWAADGMFAAVK